MNDFSRYLHLHRVRTLIQILTPYLEAGLPLNPAAYLTQFRNSPGNTHAACDERHDANGCLPLAIEDAAFERMSDKQLHRVNVDALVCLRSYYGSRLREWR